MEENFVGQVTLKAVLKYKDSFVLVKEEGGNHWILPGGRLNVGENVEDGLIREIKEELSVDSVIENILSVNAYHGGEKKKTPKLFVFYLATVLPNQEIIINSEIVDVAYVSSKTELGKYPMHENQKSVLEKFLK